MRLILLHTNDLHGQVEALARISSLAAQVRREAAAQGQATLLCDAGDAEDRTLLECDISKGRAVMTLLDAAGYDLVALGNAVVMSYGPQAAAGLARAATFPILACNLFYPDAATLVAGVRPSVLLSVGGLALGVVGMTDVELCEPFGYAGLPYEGVTFEVPTVLREALQEHFARHGTVQVAVGNRIIAED